MKTVHLIGAGLIGQERIAAARKLTARGHEVRIGRVFDLGQPRLAALAAQQGFTAVSAVEDLLGATADLVIVATPHDVAVDHALQALAAGQRVLLEKPMGRTAAEATRLHAASVTSSGRLHIGMNYRFMPGVAALLQDWRSGRFGLPLSLSFEIGHGGRPGDDKTWKLDPVRCGGGALLDPGIHLLDLALCFLGRDLRVGYVDARHGFWNTGIEERVGLYLENDLLRAHLEASVVRWRSKFEILAQGSEGYGLVAGRGRSYGRQTYRRGIRWGWQSGRSQAESEEEPVNDACEDSFADELAALLGLPQPIVATPGTADDGLAALRLVDAIRRHFSPGGGS